MKRTIVIIAGAVLLCAAGSTLFAQTTAQDLVDRAIENMETDKEGALADIDEAIKLVPEAIHYFVNRADIRTASGDNAGAIADCNAALELDPEEEQAFHNLGVAKVESGDAKTGLQDLMQAREMGEEGAESDYYVGKVKFKLSDKAAAKEFFEKACLKDPSYRKRPYR